MTRDEAIEAVRMVVKAQRREPEINLTELLVDALFALGVLKLDEPVRRSARCVPSVGDVMMAAQRATRTGDLEAFSVHPVAEIMGEQRASDWGTPSACLPPPEHQDKQWHWLRNRVQITEPWWWEGSSRAMWWRRGADDPVDAKTLAANGWRYVAPCPMPEETP